MLLDPTEAAASSARQQVCVSDGQRAAQYSSAGNCIKVYAERLARGRTLEALLTLADTRLFHLDGADAPPSVHGDLTPKRGLQAKHQLEDVYILDTFARRGKPYADVAPLLLDDREGDDSWYKLGRIYTVPCSDLSHVCSGFSLHVTGNQVRAVS